MKISMWYNNNDIRLEDVPTPEPGPREMLVKVISCGICGSDISEWYRLPRAPLVLGHEIGGEVIKTGEKVSAYKTGDRVFIAPKVPCMECEYCKNEHFPVCPNVKDRLPGGFSEYIVVPAVLVEKGTYLLPENMSYDQSTFIEPLACVVRAQRLAEIKSHQTVMIFGCGMSGLLHMKLAKTKKCKIIAVDISEKRLEYAKKYGANLVINAAENIQENLENSILKKPDVIILCTSALSAVDSAWKCVDKGGSIVFFAVPDPGKDVIIPINDFWMKEIKILTSYYCGPPDIENAIYLLGNNTIMVDDMITHTLPLNDIKKGFKLVTEANESIKVIIKPNE